MSYIEFILNQMNCDEEDPDKQSTRLEYYYQISDEQTRAVINLILICLCGWSFPTIRKNAPEYEDHKRVEEGDDDWDHGRWPSDGVFHRPTMLESGDRRS